MTCLPERVLLPAGSLMGTNKHGWIFRLQADSSKGCASAQGKDLSRLQFRPIAQHRVGVWCALMCLGASTVCPAQIFAGGVVDQLPDLTDKAAQAVITLKGRDNFNSEYIFDVSVKNMSSDPLEGESLVIVLDRITNIGGDDMTSGTSESNLSRMEILGQDGETDEGKPYFRIPRGAGSDLPPYSESSPVTVRIRNKDYLIVFTPFFRVHGLKRAPAPSKPKERLAPVTPAKTPADKLIQMLIQKDILSKEEGRALYQP